MIIQVNKWMAGLIAAVTLMTGAESVVAAGPYDGVWSISFSGILGGYYSMHENNDGTILVVELDSDFSWAAGIGQRQGNYVQFSSILGQAVNLVVDTTFTSDTTLTATQVSCTPRYSWTYCTFPNGTTFHGVKIW